MLRSVVFKPAAGGIQMAVDSARPIAKQHVTDDQPLISKHLFNGRKTIFIEHNGERYTLRITSQDKLILTK
jgi:hemin uptake protein HemP